LAAELDRPWPAVLLISATGLAIIAIFFLPYRDEEIEYENKLKEEEIMSLKDDGSKED